MSVRWLVLSILAVAIVGGSAWWVSKNMKSGGNRATISIVLLPDSHVNVAETATHISAALLSLEPKVNEVLIVSQSGGAEGNIDVTENSSWGKDIGTALRAGLTSVISKEIQQNVTDEMILDRVLNTLGTISEGDTTARKYIAVAGSFPPCFSTAQASELIEKVSTIPARKNVNLIWSLTDTRAGESAVLNSLSNKFTVIDSRIAPASTRVCTHTPTYVAVASKLNAEQASACANAIADRLGTNATFNVAYNAAIMPAIKQDERGQLVRALTTALEQGSPKTLNESSVTLKTAIVAATTNADQNKRSLVVVGQLPVDMSAIGKDQKSVLLDPSDVARLSEKTDMLSIVFVVMPGANVTNDAMIRLRGLLNRKGVMYDSVMVRMEGMSK